MTGPEPTPAPCDVRCTNPDHRRKCTYVWPHTDHACYWCVVEGAPIERITPARAAQLRALGIELA